MVLPYSLVVMLMRVRWYCVRWQPSSYAKESGVILRVIPSGYANEVWPDSVVAMLMRVQCCYLAD